MSLTRRSFLGVLAAAPVVLAVKQEPMAAEPEPVGDWRLAKEVYDYGLVTTEQLLAMAGFPMSQDDAVVQAPAISE